MAGACGVSVQTFGEHCHECRPRLLSCPHCPPGPQLLDLTGRFVAFSDGPAPQALEVASLPLSSLFASGTWGFYFFLNKECACVCEHVCSVRRWRVYSVAFEGVSARL